MATNPDSPTSADQEPAEFADAFAEFASKSEAPANAAADDKDPEPAPKEPENKPDAPAPGTDQSAAAPVPADTASIDIWANATPEQRAALDAMRLEGEHKVNSLRGRLSATDRQLDELRRSSQQPGQKPTESSAEKPGETEETDEIKRFREEYGEIAGPVMGLVDKLRGEIAELKKPIGDLETQRNETFLNEQLDQYAKAHPDWTDFANDQRFDGWLKDQPRMVREAAERNSQYIVDASEAADILTRFKTSMGVTAAPASTQPDPKRQRQKDGARAVDASTVPVTTGIPDDYEAAFSTFAKKADANQRQGHQQRT